MFSRLEKFDEPIFKAVYIGGGGLTSGILIGCHIWGVYIQGGLYMGMYKQDFIVCPDFCVSLFLKGE